MAVTTDMLSSVFQDVLPYAPCSFSNHEAPCAHCAASICWMSCRTSRARKGLMRCRQSTCSKKVTGLWAQYIPGEENHARQQVWIMLLQFAVKARPVQARHANITEDDIIGALPNGLESIMAVGRHDDE